MAHTLRYYKTLPQPGERDIVLEIYEKEGAGASVEIGPVIQALHLDIQGSQEDIDTPVVKTSLVMTFVDAPDHEEASSKKCGNWEEFYTSDSTYWKVVLKKRTASGSFTPIWGGYVTPDSFTEQLRYRGSVTIVARDNIGHMQDFPFDAKGNEDGMITVYDLVNAAWAKIESPMVLNWRGEEDSAMWLQCDGQDVIGAYLNVSAFKGMNWYEAMEKVLYSIGAVMRYVGTNIVQVSSLRYMPYQGMASMDSLSKIEPIFIAHANRELVPAVRRIEESIGYDLQESLNMPQVQTSDYTGEIVVTSLSSSSGTSFKLYDWRIGNTTPGNGWVDGGQPIYFNPLGYDITDVEDSHDSEFMWLSSSAYLGGPLRYAEYSRYMLPSHLNMDIAFGPVYRLIDDSLKLVGNSITFPTKVSLGIYVKQNGITSFLNKNGEWVTKQQTLTYDLTNGKLNIAIPADSYSGSILLGVRVYYLHSTWELDLYTPLYRLAFGEARPCLKNNTIQTTYDSENNVIISRRPEIGPAYDQVALPGFISNGIFYKRGENVLPAKAWAWSGGTPQQMAVYNHLQILCYHAKPNNVITGDIVNADLGNLRALYMWHGSEHLLQGGSLNFLNGRIEGAILREFARYDDMWGGVTGDSMPATEQESSTNVEEGGSSSGSSSTYEKTTNVTIGGKGGGSVAVDSFLSDTSTNPVQNKAIKAYVDSMDEALERRISDLENSTSAGAGAVIFDATCSNDPWSINNDLQTETTLAEMVEAINNGSPIYMRFGNGGLVSVGETHVSTTGEVEMNVFLTDTEGSIVRNIHAWCLNTGQWSWEVFEKIYATEAHVNQKIEDVETSIEQLDEVVSELDVSKAGAFYVEPSTNLFVIFTTEEAKAAYISSGDDSGVLGKFALGGGGGSTQTLYSMTVLGLQESYGYTTSSESMPISCTFKSQVLHVGSAEYVDFAEDAVITVEIFKNGAWVVASSGIVKQGSTFTFDVKPYVASGSNTIKVTAVGLISSASGVAPTTVAVTSMALLPFNFNWWSPFIEGQTYKLGGLKILGSLAKILHIEVSGNGYSKSYTDSIANQYDEIAYTYDFLEHPSVSGVYKVKMWLTAEASGLTSEVLTYNIMCVASEDVSTKQLICINELGSVVQNYAENKLFSYAVYNGGALNASPTITLKVDGKTISSEEYAVNTGMANTFSYAFAVASSAASAIVTASAVYGNTQTATFTLDNAASFAPVSGYTFYMNAATRSNNDERKRYFVNEVNGENIYATWTDMAWVEGMDGWTTDADGNKCLLIPAMSHAAVNLSPMKGVSTFALEMLYKVSNASDFDEEVITIATDTASSWMGLKIKPTNICLHSQSLFSDDLRQSYNTEEDSLVHLMVTVITEQENGVGNIAIIYVNGVKKCSFEWSTGDTFAHNGTLQLGSDTADLYLYMIRQYASPLSWPQVMQNRIASLHSIAERVNVNRKEQSALDDSNNISYDKVYGVYNTFVVRLPKGASLPNAITNPSNEAVEGTNLYINIVQDKTCSIQGDWIDVPLEGQGTTAMTYFRWNLRSKTSSAYDKFRITAKKNVASSMHSHKRGATALYNDLNLAIVGANEANGRVAVYQYPVYGFLEVENEDAPGTYQYSFIGLYTIGPDKGDKSTFGYDNEAYEDTLIHMEGTDHSPRGVGMDYPWEKMNVGINEDGDAFIGPKDSAGTGIAEEAWEIGACGDKETASTMKTYLDTEFSPAYKLDYECTPMIVGLPSGTTIAEVNANLSTFRAQEADNGFSYGDCLIYIDGEYDTYYFNIITNQYVKDGRKVYDGLSSYGFSTTTLANQSSVLAKTNYIRQYRKARYRAEMGNYWLLNDSLFHACFLDLIGATDNEKKNSYPYKFGTLASGSRWRWRQDDLDTIFDVNNQGSADKKYSILNTDKLGSTMIFKGNNSYHWRCIREYYPDEMKKMMQTIMDKMVSLCPAGYGSSKIERLVGCIRHYFWDYAQDYFTGGAYNADAKWTYEDTWVLWKKDSTINAVHPLQQSLGSHYEAEKAWVTLRMLFLASMNEWGAFVDYVDKSAGQVAFRQGGDFTFTLVPAIDMRPSVIQGSNSKKIHASGRVLAGNMVAISTTGNNAADTMVYLQGADWLQDIGDFSKAQIGSSSQNFAVTSKRLQKLKVGDSTASKVTTNIDELTIGYCPSLMEIEARNVTTLVKEVNLSQCPRLRRAYFGGTKVPAITLADGSKVTALDLPSTIQRMKLIKLPLLRTSGLTYTDLNSLTYLWVEDNAYLDGYDMLKTALEDGSPLNNIRVVGFTKTADADDTDFLLALAEGDYHGITDTGAVDNTIAPVLVGTVNYDTIDGDVYDALKAAYGNNLTINYNKLIAFIKFADAEVLQVLLDNGVDTNNDGGIEKSEAEAVTTIGKWFNNNTTIQYFNELQHFTGLTFIYGGGNSAAFYNCTSLKEVTLPSTVTDIQGYAFAYCAALSKLSADWSKIKTIAVNAFYGCTSLSFDYLNLPNLTSLGLNAFYGVKIKKLNLGKVTSLPTANSSMQNYGDKSVLEEVVLAEGLTSIPAYSFVQYSKLTSVALPTSCIAIGRNAFVDLPLTNVDLSYVEQLDFDNFVRVDIKEFITPKLTDTFDRSLYNCPLLERVNLGKVTEIKSGSSFTANTLMNNPRLREMVFPDTVTTIGDIVLAKCNALEYLYIGESISSIGAYFAYIDANTTDVPLDVIIKATTPPSLGSDFLLRRTQYTIYVPDASVDAYKEASNWSSFASKIKGISSLATDNPTFYAEIQQYL